MEIIQETFEDFLAEYNRAVISEHNNPINGSQYTLQEQLERFNNFSHNEEDCRVMQQEAAVL